MIVKPELCWHCGSLLLDGECQQGCKPKSNVGTLVMESAMKESKRERTEMDQLEPFVERLNRLGRQGMLSRHMKLTEELAEAAAVDISVAARWMRHALLNGTDTYVAEPYDQTPQPWDPINDVNVRKLTDGDDIRYMKAMAPLRCDFCNQPAALCSCDKPKGVGSRVKEKIPSLFESTSCGCTEMAARWDLWDPANAGRNEKKMVEYLVTKAKELLIPKLVSKPIARKWVRDSIEEFKVDYETWKAKQK